MPAQKRNIKFEENGSFKWNIRLETSLCSVIDITGYGARLDVRDTPEGTLIFRATHADQINVNATTDEFEIDVAQGSIAFIKEDFRNLRGLRATYDVVVWPNASTPNVDPLPCFYGDVVYRLGVTEL